ncbi:MAG TPA: lipid II flippase MurJ, partial [Tepidiformaceae bacterium]|nr:lipid II flippase MurJ [Tepidiformaceae bacterium]
MAEIPAETAATALPPRTGGLAVAATIVAFGFVGSRLLGVVRSIVIANQFGTSADYEAYVVAFRIPDLIFQVLAGATLGSAFIPVFARLYRRENEARAWELASKVMTLITAATAALCLLAFLLAPWLVPLTAPGLDNEGKAVFLTRFMLLSPLLFAMSGMVTGILNARQLFFLPALAPMLYNLAIIFGAVVLAEEWGINGLAAGVVIGAGLHLLVQVPGLVRERMKFRPSFDWRDGAVREVGRLMGPRVIGLAAAQLNFV